MKNAYDPLTDRWEKRAMERLSYSAAADLLEGRDKKSTLFERLALGGPKKPSVSLDYLNLCASESSGTARAGRAKETERVPGLPQPLRLGVVGHRSRWEGQRNRACPWTTSTSAPRSR